VPDDLNDRCVGLVGDLLGGVLQLDRRVTIEANLDELVRSERGPELLQESPAQAFQTDVYDRFEIVRQPAQKTFL
jgi:hypothetical protein